MKRAGQIIIVLGFFLFAQAAQADWTAAKRLTWTSVQSMNPAIAVGPSGNVHVIWYDKASGSYEIYYKKSTDGGTTWLAGQRLTWTGGSYVPDIAVDAVGNPHVVWERLMDGHYEVFYRKSTDGGTTWLASQRLTWNSGDSMEPVIAVDSTGSLHVAWYDYTPGNYEVYYRKSKDGGATWSAGKRLTWTSFDSYEVSLALDLSDNPHVVWYEDTPAGNYEIYYKRSKDGGTTWSTARRLTATTTDSQYPVIAVDTSGYLYVAWSEYIPGNSELYGKKSEDGGDTWSGKRVTFTAGYSTFPDMVTDSSGSLHIVWAESTPGNYEIYYKKTTDGGDTWSTKRLTFTVGYSTFPDIAVDSSGNAHVVWHDDTPGNYEIYYIRGK
jgi:BNR repeat-like domain